MSEDTTSVMAGRLTLLAIAVVPSRSRLKKTFHGTVGKLGAPVQVQAE